MFLANCFLPNLQLNIGKKYLKTANIIDESLILAIDLSNYSTKPSYIFQLKRELKVWKYIFNRSANFQIKLAPLILYTTLVYTSTLKSTV
jgi:hypothetical protein